MLLALSPELVREGEVASITRLAMGRREEDSGWEMQLGRRRRRSRLFGGEGELKGKPDCMGFDAGSVAMQQMRVPTLGSSFRWADFLSLFLFISSACCFLFVPIRVQITDYGLDG